MSEPQIYPKEDVLPDDYPIHCGCWYVFDGEPRQADSSGTVEKTKRETGTKEIRRCQIVARMKASRKLT